MFQVGQKVKLVRSDSGLERAGFKEGDIVLVAGTAPGGLIGVKSLDGSKSTPTNGWFSSRFEAVSFEPKFRKGQKLRVVDASPQIDGSVSTLSYAGFKNGDIVVASADSFLEEGQEEEVHIDGISWIARRFEAAPEEKAKLKAGQKVRFVKEGGGNGYQGIVVGDIVTVVKDEYLENGDSFVTVEASNGEKRTYYASRFEAVAETAAPAPAPFVPTFKRGAWLKLKDADGQAFLKVGDIVKATRASYLGVDGKELVDFLDNDGYARVFYASRFAVEAHPEFPPETYLVIRPTARPGRRAT
jgi:hypothetical protein